MPDPNLDGSIGFSPSVRAGSAPRMLMEHRVDREHALSGEQGSVVVFSRDAGHLLVLARPGSGKTHTLTARARRLLDDGSIPANCSP